jgi:Fe-S-cluster containining protein
MNRLGHFSYLCNQCGRCCHNQVITLSPYDTVRLARAAGLSTSEAVAKYTSRRGSILRFDPDGSCSALDGTACTLHSGRPLACRLYPLGLERDRPGAERYLRLEPAVGSRGVFGHDGTVEDFLAQQDAELYLQMNDRYASLLGVFCERINELSDFDTIEPREFWRVAVREALAESGFDFNPIIEALFDPDSLGCRANSDIDFVNDHIRRIEQKVRDERNPQTVGAAAVALAVSLGYSPGEVINRVQYTDEPWVFACSSGF